MMVVVAAIVASVSVLTQRSSERSGDAARRVSNDATVQIAVTRIQYALQNDLGSEQDFYILDAADLEQVTSQADSTAVVRMPADLPGLPTEFTTVRGVYEHYLTGGGAGTHRLRPVNQPTTPAIVEEQVDLDPSVCTSSGLPASACDGDIRSYWQVYRTIMPDITGSEPPNVVVYLRTWLGSPADRAYSRASYARAELRPGRFADFQQISDGNVRIGAGATINGPVHSNGLADGSFSTVQEAPSAAVGGSARWIYADPATSCSGSASLSITAGVINAPGACRSLGATGQLISFLRAIDSIQTIRDAATAGRPNTGSFDGTGRRGNEAALEPYGTAWDVNINNNVMIVRYPDGSPAGAYPLGRVNAYVFDEDVRVRGRAADDVRITIAAERAGGGAASIFVDGDLYKVNAQTSAIGLIAQGDVVLWMRYDTASSTHICPVGRLQAAVVAATGGLTIPTKYTTSELQTVTPKCTRTLEVDGSIAGHRPPTMVWQWDPPYAAGYTNRRDYKWDQALQRNPPPYFPLTGTWQPYQVREANVDCLINAAQLNDPTCK